MSLVLQPAVWLLVLIAGLPLLSETIYSPSLPDIARALKTSEAMAEYTLTIYLFAFAIGILFWGKVSDRFGRKPCVLIGFFVFILGCTGCYFSESITMFMVSRFIQAFGGCVGSVLGQSITRDAFHGTALGKVYSTVGSSISVFPAIGPFIGGVIAERFNWSNIFLFVIAFTILLNLIILWKLPETHHKENRKHISLLSVLSRFLRDKKLMGFALIVGVCNGVQFSYFAEGSFVMIELLGLSPSQYGVSFLFIAFSSLLGGLSSRQLHHTRESKTILRYGLKIVFGGYVLFSSIVLATLFIDLSKEVLLIMILFSQMVCMFGVCMATSNALSMALVDYKWCTGTASSLFGFFYYFIVSLITLGMGTLHNGTIFPMPLYFLMLGIFALWTGRYLLEKER